MVADAPEVVVALEVVGLTVVVVVADAPEVVVALEVVGLTVVTVDEAGPSRLIMAEPMAATPKMAPRPTTAVLSFFIGASSSGRLHRGFFIGASSSGGSLGAVGMYKAYTRKTAKSMGKVQRRVN